jgi:hypothetical protein
VAQGGGPELKKKNKKMITKKIINPYQLLISTSQKHLL